MHHLIEIIEEKAKKEYYRKIDLLKLIKDVNTISFTINEIENLELINFDEFIAPKNFKIDINAAYVYFFEIENIQDWKKLSKVFYEKKVSKHQNRSYTSLNSSCKIATKILYVGSKKTTFTTRLKQHLGLLAESTGALHLKYWFPKDSLLKFHYIEIPDKSMTYDIESVLRKELNPILGQK